MPKLKLLVLAAFAVFVLSVPATAFAKEGGLWLVNGSGLAPGAVLLLLPTALVLSVGELKVVGAGSVICKGEQLLLEEGKIIGPDGILVKKITFHECEFVGGGCSLKGSLIETEPVDGLASLDLPGSLNTYILLLPETKKTFTTLTLEGATCSIAGKNPVNGSVSLLVHGGLHEVLLHLVLAFSLKEALKVGGNEAELKGLDFDLALLGHENWSFH